MAHLILNHIPGLEIYLIEQRYMRRKKRNGFTNNVQYVDGEYVYNPSSSPGLGSDEKARFPSKVKVWEAVGGREGAKGR